MYETLSRKQSWHSFVLFHSVRISKKGEQYAVILANTIVILCSMNGAELSLKAAGQTLSVTRMLSYRTINEKKRFSGNLSVKMDRSRAVDPIIRSIHDWLALSYSNRYFCSLYRTKQIWVNEFAFVPDVAFFASCGCGIRKLLLFHCAWNGLWMKYDRWCLIMPTYVGLMRVMNNTI